MPVHCQRTEDCYNKTVLLAFIASCFCSFLEMTFIELHSEETLDLISVIWHGWFLFIEIVLIACHLFCAFHL